MIIAVLDYPQLSAPSPFSAGWSGMNNKHPSPSDRCIRKAGVRKGQRVFTLMPIVEVKSFVM